ncbi:polyisoprenoid-binding protein [Lysobacter arenosi]|uniref:Polyisoprenoid-binding protein n=1 Tax=Lysobacter arenosi TaxID=2795387 RepID=A0ABX7RE65_9GAMM|nr:YceI family protein [Lysobacter arenosi]QSX76449.1 polyisoprenoid-binding protein [Lysobacter arenosi]
MSFQHPVFARLALAATLLALAAVASAKPVRYEIDPAHTFPSFEADHMGVSVWRGKFNSSQGEISLDKSAGTGTVEVTIDTASVDYGLDVMNDKAREADLLDAVKFPKAVYKGRLADFRDGAPTRVKGELTLRGVTRPLDLTIDRFKCIPHPLHKRELCGADALGTFRRDEFGIDAGKDYGFDMNVTLRIQVEAVQEAQAQADKAQAP